MNHWGKSVTTRSSRRRRGGRAIATAAVVAVVASLFAPLGRQAGRRGAGRAGVQPEPLRPPVHPQADQDRRGATPPRATPANPCGTLLGTGPNQIPNGNQQGAELPWGLRTVDGTCNNLLPGQEKFGAADTVFPRQGPARFRDAETGDPDGPGPAPDGPTSYTQKRGTVIDSQPRTVSNLIVDQTETNPAAVAAADGADT